MIITSLDTIEKLNSFSEAEWEKTKSDNGLKMVDGNIIAEVFPMSDGKKLDIAVSVNDRYVLNKVVEYPETAISLYSRVLKVVGSAGSSLEEMASEARTAARGHDRDLNLDPSDFCAWE